MIKNDALDEILDLNHRWESLTTDLFEDAFDYEFFKLLAVHTFAFLFPYHTAESFPREIMSVLFKIKEFASCPVSVSRESNAAQLVAQSFCFHMEDHWLKIDKEYSTEELAVCDHYGDYYIVDANTFDLSEFM